MAYDPNDPADKAVFDAAVAEALEEAQEAHQAEVTRLTNKNTELLGKLRKARSGGEEGNSSAAEIAQLEADLDNVRGELATAQSSLRDANRKLVAAERDRDTARTSLATETTFSTNMLSENALTSALTEAKVTPELMEAVKALHGKAVTIKEVDGKRNAFVGDKPLGDFIKEWAASDAAKPFISAPGNAGGGSNEANGNAGGGKKLADMSEAERLAMARTNPAGWTALLAAENPTT